ncbi:RHS repeat-associated core domain-containing protein [Streptomyces hyaluromycini]|uniref:RHS repeat-associated core domain-containing protein n=1 Tax=Streptomyces hyaluromycini TaxID=1377993 RepID=UPI000B5C9E27|nr:RHS repeat-associated core domain-containing protein [Streptomyces hyaluromycini]
MRPAAVRVRLVFVLALALLTGLLGPNVGHAGASAVVSKPLPPGVVSAPAKPDPNRPTQSRGKPGDAWHKALARFDAAEKAQKTRHAPVRVPASPADRKAQRKLAALRAAHPLPKRPPYLKGPTGSRSPSARRSTLSTATTNACLNEGPVPPDPTPYRATYAPEQPFAVRPAYDVNGAMWVTVKNTSTKDWAANSVILGYHLYRGDQSAYDCNGYGTQITVAVARGQSVRVLANVEELPAGAFSIVWDARLNTDASDTWFSTHGVPVSAAYAFNVPHSAPSGGSLVYPRWGETVATLTPQMEFVLAADKTQPVQSEFVVCEDQEATKGCHDSGWQDVTMGDGFQAAALWTVPPGWLKWNTTYFWRARARDSLTGLWSPTSPFTPVVTPAASQGSHYGVDPATLDPAGVNLFAGNYTHDETDLSVPVPDGAQPLAVERVYNSVNTVNGAFGTGWSSILDMAIDPTSEGWVRASFKDGKQIQFGKNPDGSWAASYGEGDSVKYEVEHDTGVPWLRFKDGSSAEFSPTGGHQPVKRFYAPDGSQLYFGVSGGHITEIDEGPSQRSIFLTWTGSHVTAVSAGLASGERWNTWKYTYTGNQLTQVCDAEPTPRCTSYAYGATDSSHTVPRLTQITRPNTAAVTKLTYSGDRLYTIAYPSDLVSGGWDTWFYRRINPPSGDTNASDVIHTTDPTGVDVYYEFDAHGSLLSRWTGGTTPTHGDIRSWQYDNIGRVAALTDENDNITEYHWDSITGRLQDQNRNRDTTGTIVNTHYEYDSTPYANTLSVADGNHHAVTMTYSGERLKTRTTPPTKAAPNGATTTYGYTCDSGTQPPVVNDPAAPVGSVQPCGLLATVTDPDGHVTHYGYDRFGDRTLEQLPTGGTVNSYFDSHGLMNHQTVSDTPGGSGYTTSYTYDTHGRVLSAIGDTVHSPTSNQDHQLQVFNTYDADGNLASASRVDYLGLPEEPNVTRYQSYAYDARDHLTSTTQDGHVLSHQLYDGVGHVADSWDANNIHYHYTYDSRGQLSSVAIPAYTDTPGQSGAATRSVRLKAYDYDNAGRLSDFWDAKGHVVSYTYTHDDLLKSETYITHADPDNPDSTRDVPLHSYTYDLAGNLLKDVEGGGSDARTTTYGYDDANERTSTTVDPDGLNRTTAYSYDKAGLQTGTTVSDGTRTESTSQSYDPVTGAMTQSVVHNDVTADLVTTYTRDAFGRVLTVTDPRQNTTSYTYDPMGRTSTVTGPAVPVEDGSGAGATMTRPVSKYGYDAFGESEGFRDPKGGGTGFTYDTRGNLTDVISTDGSFEHRTYDYAGNVLSETNSESGRSDYTYDARNRVHTATRWNRDTNKADGAPATYAYDDNSNLLSAISFTGAQTLSTYDDMDRRQTLDEVVRNGTATPDQEITQYRYDDFGEPTHSWQTIDGKVFESRSGYNAAGELSSESETGRGTTNYLHDVAGRLTLVTDPLQRSTETDYDLAGRRTAVIAKDADGNEVARTDYTVDPAGNVTAVKDPNRNVWQASYDAGNRLTALTDPAPTAADGTVAANPVTTIGYDVLGDATRVTDADQHTTYQTYAGSWLQTRVEPATSAQPAAADRTWTYEHSSGVGGRLTKVTEPGGVSTSYTYDTYYRNTGQTGTGGAGGTVNRSFGYDLDDRPTSIGTPGGTENFTYDDRGLLTGSNGALGTSTYHYDSLGRLTYQQDPATSVSYGYSGLEDVGSVYDGLTGASVSYTRDTAGQVKKITGSVPGEGTYYPAQDLTYDGLGRLTSETVTPDAPFQDQKSTLSYTWDKNGNLKTATRTGRYIAAGTTSYDYDEDNRLVRSSTDGATPTGTDYTWDAVGNRTWTTPWSGSAHTPTGATTAAQYDERNRLTRSAANGGDTTGYDWTPRGTLAKTTTTMAGGATSAAASLFDSFDRLVGDGQHTYSYDSLDRLLSVSDGMTTRQLGYGGLSKEPDSDGSWTYARAADGTLLSGKPAGGTAMPLVQDVHGNVVASLDTTFGDVFASRAYDPFGKVTAQSNAATMTVGFQGSWTDSTTGRVSAESRWYDPGSGTFASADTAPVPVTDATSTNDYLYGNANPTSRLDPDGHMSLTDVVSGVKNWTQAQFDDEFWSMARNYGSEAVGAAAEAAGAVVEGAEVVAGAAATVGAGEVLLVVGGVVVVVAASAILYDAATGTATFDASAIRTPAVPPPPTTTVPPQPPHPTKPVVTSTKQQTSTTSWQTTSKWLDDGYLYTRTDYYSYTTTQQWTYYDNGTTAYRWWRSPTRHRWTTERQPMIDLDHPIRIADAAPRKPTAPTITAAADDSATCGSQGSSTNSCIAGVRGGGLPPGAGDGGGGFCVGGLLGFSCSASGNLLDMVTGAVACGLGDAVLGSVCQGGTDSTDDTAGGQCSFRADTPVLMADGKTKPIGEVKPGDEVEAADPGTGEHRGTRKVTALHRNLDNDLVDVTVHTPDGHTETLHTTSQHPFWDETDHAWVPAADLKPHDALATADGHKAYVVIVRGTPGAGERYNLTVSQLHTYYVLAGETPILVHNSGPCNVVVGNGASLDNLTGSEIARIQNAADRIGHPISVVGSRATGNTHALSDWDYVITGINSRTKHSVKSSLPQGSIELGRGGRIDIFTWELAEGAPHITFYPRG